MLIIRFISEKENSWREQMETDIVWFRQFARWSIPNMTVYMLVRSICKRTENYILIKIKSLQGICVWSFPLDDLRHVKEQTEEFKWEMDENYIKTKSNYVQV